ERLEHAPEPVVDVEAQRNDRHDIEDRRERILERVYGIGVSMEDAILWLKMLAGDIADHAERDIQNMIDDEQKQNNAAPAHRARGIAGLHILPSHIAHPARSASPILPRKLIGSYDMQAHGGQQPKPHDP